MLPTALIYSSHNRCELIHRWWLVERALKSIDNKTLFHVPMSMNEMHQQEYSWGTFRWYLNQFTKWGLKASNFYWRDALAHEDLKYFFEQLMNSEVVVLGGGNNFLGMQRYKELGARLCNNENLFGEILRQRQKEGKLTAGFSAGANQLCSLMEGSRDYGWEEANGFGLCHNIVATLHHEWGQEKRIQKEAEHLPHFMAFGLPNDSGIAVEQGYLPSGNMWQIIEFIVDTTWDIPEDNWHIKTRSGMNIEHYYNDGRNWTFHNGDKVVRIIDPQDQDFDAWIIPASGGPIYHYWSQEGTHYQNADEILSQH